MKKTASAYQDEVLAVLLEGGASYVRSKDGLSVYHRSGIPEVAVAAYLTLECSVACKIT